MAVLDEFLASWKCFTFFGMECDKIDISNTWSTWVGIIVGGAIGAAITWWIYYRQKKTSEKQEQIIERIRYLEEKHDSILKSIEAILNQILILGKKIDSIIEDNTS
jgi:formate/nitrite transporter FocA (FNT family)